MENKYFAELTRRLNGAGIGTGIENSERLPVVLNGQTAMSVSQDGVIFLMRDRADTPEVRELYHKVAGISKNVMEYIKAMESAPHIPSEGSAGEFSILADFNGCVLAARDHGGGRGFEFVTWRWCYKRAGVTQGDYFEHDYEAAKADFTVRAGLIQKERLFTDEQLTELYRCIHETLDAPYEMTDERLGILQDAAAQIERSVPDLEVRISQSNLQEMGLSM